MKCNCVWCETIIAVIIIILALWPALLGATVSKWIVVIAGVALILHAHTCKKCKHTHEMDMMGGKSRKR